MTPSITASTSYVLSHLRIRIEMSLGLLTTKWQLLHQKTETSLKNIARILECCAGLHSFIIDNMGDDKETSGTPRVIINNRQQQRLPSWDPSSWKLPSWLRLPPNSWRVHPTSRDFPYSWYCCSNKHLEWIWSTTIQLWALAKGASWDWLNVVIIAYVAEFFLIQLSQHHNHFQTSLLIPNWLALL